MAVKVGVWVGVFEGVSVGVLVGVGELTGVSVGVGVPVPVGVIVGVEVGVGVGDGTPGDGPPLHAVMLLVSIVTVAFRARNLPSTLALVFAVMLARARTFPTRAVPVPIVAELPTCHHTPQAVAPLVSVIDELLAVVSELPI